MTSVNATNLRKNLFTYLDSAIEYNDIINISTKKGNAIILSEEEYSGLMETLELFAVPGMKERIIEGQNAKAEDMEDFSWDTK
ncbi:MAG: type II toxin-antitoxin system Phd/YefM family antitoxin [Anaerovoracaceae bacterium]